LYGAGCDTHGLSLSAALATSRAAPAARIIAIIILFIWFHSFLFLLFNIDEVLGSESLVQLAALQLFRGNTLYFLLPVDYRAPPDERHGNLSFLFATSLRLNITLFLVLVASI